MNGGGGEYMNNQKYAHTLLMGISIFCTHENTVIQYMNTVKQPVMKEPRLTKSGLSSKLLKLNFINIFICENCGGWWYDQNLD